MGPYDEFSDQALDCLLRSAVREGLLGYEPPPHVWERVIKRLRRNAPAPHTQFALPSPSSQQQLLLFSVIRLETHCHFLTAGVLRAV